MSPKLVFLFFVMAVALRYGLDSVDKCLFFLILAVDGGWSAWGDYGLCSVKCGGGTRTRTRSCTSPAPSGGGADCAGNASETGPCKQHTCAGEFCKTTPSILKAVIVRPKFEWTFHQKVYSN